MLLQIHKTNALLQQLVLVLLEQQRWNDKNVQGQLENLRMREIPKA
jgi:hypothetical protein